MTLASGARAVGDPEAAHMEPIPQTFGFENCVDLVWKLYWEIERLHNAMPHDVIDMKCFAFNAAVTAWHLTDWVFEDMTPTQRAQHGTTSLKGFQNYVRQQCRSIHLCRQIATASKHRVVTLHVDQGVDAGIVFGAQKDGQFASWSIVVKDGAVIHPALDVLENARLYWHQFISSLGLIY